jgi:hypothetical protein
LYLICLNDFEFENASICMLCIPPYAQQHNYSSNQAMHQSQYVCQSQIYSYHFMF